MRILAFTSTRADYGILRPLLSLLDGSQHLDLELLVTGTHLSHEHGRTIDAIEADGFKTGLQVEILSSEPGWQGATNTMATCMNRFGVAISETAPDVALVLGDRFETFCFAAVCHTARIPLIHIHGGEVTVGAVDDAFRHSITKFSHLHLVAAEEFRRRVIQLGEASDSVHNIGALGLDAIRSELAGLELHRSATALVTYHPATLSAEDPEQTLHAILRGCLSSDLERVVVSRPNIDAGAETINRVIDEYRDVERVEIWDSLGSGRYIRELAQCTVVLGNSSSGIIEAPFVGTPTINVGRRQLGRPQASSIMNLDIPDEREVAAAIGKARTLASEPFFPTAYGDGRSAPRAAQLVEDMSITGMSKYFQDIEVR